MSVVLDSSATLAWIYGDETTDAIRALFDRVADAGAVVPALWRLEVANSLTVAIRRGRVDVDFRRAALSDLALLDITIDQQTDSQAWGRRCTWPIAFGSRCTTRPISNWPTGVCCRSPRSTAICGPQEPRSVSALWERTDLAASPAPRCQGPPGGV